MAGERRVIIASEDPERPNVAVTPAAFARGQADRYAGYAILYWEGGEAYEAPQTGGGKRSGKAAQPGDADGSRGGE